MLRPMVDFTFKTDINYIEVVEPNIPGNLVSAIPPDIFLFIKCGLIRRKVFQMDLGMLAKKKSDFFSLMPFSPINKEVDDITSKSFQHMLQNLYKSLLVTSGSAYQPFTPQQGSHPARQVQPLTVLAGSRNLESFTFLSPTSSQPRMQAKASLILKNDGLILLQATQFFLTPGENGGHLLSGTEDKHSRLASGYNPDNAASIVPVVPSTLYRTASSGEQPEWDHPSQLLTDQIPGELSLNLALVVPLRLMSTESAGLVVAGVSETRFHFESTRESNSPESYGLGQTKRSPIPDAGPPIPAIKQRFLSQSKLPELALPGLKAFLWLFPVVQLKPSWLKYRLYFVNAQLFNALVLVLKVNE